MKTKVRFLIKHHNWFLKVIVKKKFDQFSEGKKLLIEESPLTGDPCSNRV